MNSIHWILSEDVASHFSNYSGREKFWVCLKSSSKSYKRFQMYYLFLSSALTIAAFRHMKYPCYTSVICYVSHQATAYPTASWPQAGVGICQVVTLNVLDVQIHLMRGINRSKNICKNRKCERKGIHRMNFVPCCRNGRSRQTTRNFFKKQLDPFVLNAHMASKFRFLLFILFKFKCCTNHSDVDQTQATILRPIIIVKDET